MPGREREATEGLRWLASIGYACAPCLMLSAPERLRRDERHARQGGAAANWTISRFVAAYGRDTPGAGSVDNMVCEPMELCERSGRPDCRSLRDV